MIFDRLFKVLHLNPKIAFVKLFLKTQADYNKVASKQA